MTRHLLMAAALLLSACAPKFEPPADYVGGFLWDNNKSRVVSVQAGDTLFAISRRYDVPAKSIIARNDLQPPYQLRIGQELILDSARSYRIQAGDTLSKIAKQYGVEMRLIAEANDLVAPYVIKIGQDLWIPDPFSIAAAPTVDVPGRMADAPISRPTPPPAPIARQELAPPPSAAPQPIVQQQPTVTAPSTANQPPQALARSQIANEALPPPGQVARAEPAGPLVRETQSSPSSQAATGRSPPDGASSSPTLVEREPDEPAPLKKPEPRAASRFVWPLTPDSPGTVIAGFGPAGKGLHNDGINIAAPMGAKVRAADNGVVAYSGNELKGFGNLLLIKHADGWTTAYAHNASLLVKRGDVVKQGQDIATVGRTGNVQVPQLHFEVRKGTQPIDPLIHLQRPSS